MNIRYEPWSLRGYEGPVFQVYVEILDSHDTGQLRELKSRLNNPPQGGLHIAENKSRALEKIRMGKGYRWRILLQAV